MLSLLFLLLLSSSDNKIQEVTVDKVIIETFYTDNKLSYTQLVLFRKVIVNSKLDWHVADWVLIDDCIVYPVTKRDKEYTYLTVGFSVRNGQGIYLPKRFKIKAIIFNEIETYSNGKILDIEKANKYYKLDERDRISYFRRYETNETD